MYRFCPQCGGTLEPRLLKSTEPARPVCARCGFVFYLDPKVAVGTIIATASGGIVLVRRARRRYPAPPAPSASPLRPLPESPGDGL